jgi:hypothetical protein
MRETGRILSTVPSTLELEEISIVKHVYAVTRIDYRDTNAEVSNRVECVGVTTTLRGAAILAARECENYEEILEDDWREGSDGSQQAPAWEAERWAWQVNQTAVWRIDKVAYREPLTMWADSAQQKEEVK